VLSSAPSVVALAERVLPERSVEDVVGSSESTCVSYLPPSVQGVLVAPKTAGRRWEMPSMRSRPSLIHPSA
jgi:hypothetical protein